MAYFLEVLFFVYGIFGIIRYFKGRAFKLELWISILSVIVGFVYIFRPGNTAPVGNLIGIDKVALFFIALWFIIKGVIYIRTPFNTRSFNNKWGLGVFSGILSIVLGVYSLFHPEIAAMSTGVLIGLYYVQCGVELLVFGSTTTYVKNAVKKLDDNIRETVTNLQEAYEEASAEASKAAEAAEEAVEEAVDS